MVPVSISIAHLTLICPNPWGPFYVNWIYIALALGVLTSTAYEY